MVCQSHTHITAWCVIHDQVQATCALKGKIKSNYELVVGQRQDISLSASISDKILGQDFIFFQDFHGIVFLAFVTFFADEIDRAKTTLTQRFNDLKRVKVDFTLFGLSTIGLVFISILDFDYIHILRLRTDSLLMLPFLRVHGVYKVDESG